jgi:hypothetical protein
VVSADAAYHSARQAFVANYQAFPQIIVYCEVFSDAAAALAFAREWKLSPVCRAGGHSTAGYSVNNGMIIDVSRLSYVVVDSRAKRAVVGAGTNFGHLNACCCSCAAALAGNFHSIGGVVTAMDAAMRRRTNLCLLCHTAFDAPSQPSGYRASAPDPERWTCGSKSMMNPGPHEV